MGYTVYWRMRKDRTEGQGKKYRQALKHCNKVIQKFHNEYIHLSGYSAHTSKYDGIKFNGAHGRGCEDFCLRAELWEHDDFAFCKTKRRLYSVPVFACLFILKHCLGDLITIESDGHDYDFQGMAWQLLKDYGKLKIKPFFLED